MIRFAFAGVLVLCLAACSGGEEECLYAAQGAESSAPQPPDQRNPETGICEVIDYGSWGGDDGCCGGACNDLRDPPNYYRDWADCNQRCEWLDEAACLSADGCRGAYVGETFRECWGTAPSGPVRGGDCSSFNAETCSAHDDCIAVHEPGQPIGVFSQCAPEGAVPPEVGSCIGDVSCDMLTPDCPDGTLPGRIPGGCWTGFCIPLADCDVIPGCDTLSESECVGRTDCVPTYSGEECICEEGTDCSCAEWIYKICKWTDGV